MEPARSRFCGPPEVKLKLRFYFVFITRTFFKTHSFFKTHALFKIRTFFKTHVIPQKFQTACSAMLKINTTLHVRIALFLVFKAQQTADICDIWLKYNFVENYALKTTCSAMSLAIFKLNKKKRSMFLKYYIFMTVVT